MTYNRPGCSGHLTVMIAAAVFMLAIAGFAACAAASGHEAHGGEEGSYKLLKVFGRVTNPHDTGVGDVDLEVKFNGIALEPVPEKGSHAHGTGGVNTEADGTFQAVFHVPEADLHGADITITAFKPQRYQ